MPSAIADAPSIAKPEVVRRKLVSMSADGAMTDVPNAPPVPVPASSTSILPQYSQKQLVTTSADPIPTLWIWGGTGQDPSSPGAARTVPVYGFNPPSTMNPSFPTPYLSVFAYWYQIQTNEVSPNVGFTHTYTFNAGTSSTTESTFSWEINADVSIGPVGLGATIAGMVNESITMFSGTSETDTYTAPVVDQIQVCTLWQLYFDYVITDVDANPIVYSGDFSRPSWQGRAATLGGSDPNTTNTLTFPTNQVYFSVVPVAS